MGNKHNLLAAVSLVALSATAHADDMTVPEVPDWTGFYMGAGGGGSFMLSALELDDDNIARESWSDDAGVAQGFGTIDLGADYQFDSNFLIGAVGNFDFGAGTDLGSLPTMGSPIAEWEAGNSWGIGARAGFLASPRTLIYGVGGFTQLEVSTDLFAGTGAATSDDEWTSGYFVGAGVETLLTDKLSVKLEYRFSRYDEVS
ncbi:MAG: outer membrane beta-barrel protein, partial [Aestuariivirga sp.]